MLHSWGRVWLFWPLVLAHVLAKISPICCWFSRRVCWSPFLLPGNQKAGTEAEQNDGFQPQQKHLDKNTRARVMWQKHDCWEEIRSIECFAEWLVPLWTRMGPQSDADCWGPQEAQFSGCEWFCDLYGSLRCWHAAFPRSWSESQCEGSRGIDMQWQGWKPNQLCHLKTPTSTVE